MSWRKITVNDKVWTYYFGKGNVVIKSPEGNKTIVSYTKLTGKSWDIIERGQYKKKLRMEKLLRSTSRIIS